MAEAPETQHLNNVGAGTPKLADSIVVRVGPGRYDYTLTIDGHEFPWFISDVDGIQAGRIARDHLPTLTVTLLASRLDVVHAVPTREAGAS